MFGGLNLDKEKVKETFHFELEVSLLSRVLTLILSSSSSSNRDDNDDDDDDCDLIIFLIQR